MNGLPAHRFFERTAPQDGSAASGSSFGASAVVATSSTAASLDLRLLSQSPPGAGGGAAVTPLASSQNQFVDVTCDGAETIYVSFSQTATTVKSAVPTAPGINVTGNGYAIFPNTTQRFWIRNNVDNFINYVAASATPTLRIFVSSRT